MQTKDINIRLCQDMLKEGDARLINRDAIISAPLSDVQEVSVEWGPFPTTGDIAHLEEGLRKFTWVRNLDDTTEEKSYVEGDYPNEVAFVVDRIEFYDRWRQAFVKTRTQVVNGEVENYVGITLRKGFLTAYSGLSDLRITKAMDKEGNAVDIDGKTWTASTTSANPGLVWFAQVKNISREAAATVMGGLPHTLTAGQEIDGLTVPVDRTLYKTIADTAESDDGSSIVNVIYADEQFAFNGYESSNTVDERSIGYLWNVPRQLGETIADEWYAEADTARRGCTASLSGEGQGYVNLILTARSGSKDNMTTPWIPVAGKADAANDTTLRWERKHFAWGYTKAEIYESVAGTGFIANHDSAIGTVEDTHAITARRIDVQQRGDALYDAIITEQSFGTHTVAGEPSTPDFTITVPVGTAITRQDSYGYDVRLSELETVKAVYERVALPAVGGTVGSTTEFRITRRDDWSFDYVATIIVASEIDSAQQSNQPVDGEGDPVVTTTGVIDSVQAIAHATADEVGEALIAFVPGIGKSIQVNLSVNDDETFGAVLREVTAQTPEGTAEIERANDGADPKIYTGYGTGISLSSGHNATLAEVTTAVALFTSGARKSIDLNIRAADDGGWDYSIVEREVQAVVGTKVIGDHTFYFGLNVDDDTAGSVVATGDGSAPEVLLTGVVVRSSSVVSNSDGTKNYSILVSPLNTATPTATETAALSNKRYVQQGINQTELPVSTGLGAVGEVVGDEITGDRLLSYSARFGDNSKYDYAIVSQDLDEVTDEGTDGGSGRTRTVSAGLHSAAIPTPVSTRLIRDIISPSPEETGGFSWTRYQDSIVESGPTSWNAGSRGAAVAIEHARNVAALSDPGTPSGKGVSSTLRAGYDDAGNLIYTLQTVTKSEQEAIMYGGTATSKQAIAVHVGDVTQSTGDLGTNVAQAEGTTVLWNARMNADGALDWTKSTSVAQIESIGSIVFQRLKPRIRGYGFTETAGVFKNVKQANMAGYGVPDDEYGYISQLTMNADGTLNGILVEVVYDYTGTVPVICLPSGSFTFKKEYWLGLGGYSYRYEQDFTCTVYQSDSWSSVASSISGTIGGCGNINMMSFFGDPTWVGWKVEKTGDPALKDTIEIGS